MNKNKTEVSGKYFELLNHCTFFTLVELLVVIGILVILMSILLPSLNKARDMAKRTDCSNNLRQIGLSSFSYCDSFNEYLPVAWLDKESWIKRLYLTDMVKANRTTFSGVDVDGYGVLREVSASYINIFRCPREAKWKEAEQASFADFYKTCYGLVISQAWQMGITDYGSGHTNWKEAGIIPSRISHPSLRALFVETDATSNANAYAAYDYRSLGNANIAYPHRGVGNIFCIDGHVETKTWASLQGGSMPYIGRADY